MSDFFKWQDTLDGQGFIRASSAASGPVRLLVRRDINKPGQWVCDVNFYGRQVGGETVKRGRSVDYARLSCECLAERLVTELGNAVGAEVDHG